MKEIVLASSSPRRVQLLEETGLRFQVEPSRYIEEASADKDPRIIAGRNALEKAKAIAAKHSKAIVIGADTIGFLDGKILGKPRTKAEAVSMLRSMSGKCHLVITGICVIESDTGKTVNELVETKVCFKHLADADIDAYVDSGEPMDKAVAYGIQGLGSNLVDHIEGGYSNVVGLPVDTLLEILAGFGIHIPTDTDMNSQRRDE